MVVITMLLLAALFAPSGAASGVQDSKCGAATGLDLHDALSAAEAAITRGDCASAIAPYQKATALMPILHEAWLRSGVCLSQVGRAAEAEAALKKYLSFQPLSGGGHTALGLLYLKQARFAEARTELRKALDIDPEAVEVASGLARAQVKLKDDAGALQFADRAFALQPAKQPLDLYLMAAEISLRLGDRQRVMDYCTRGRKLYPADESLQEFLSNWLLGCVDVPACRVEMEAALQSQAQLHADWISAHP